MFEGQTLSSSVVGFLLAWTPFHIKTTTRAVINRTINRNIPHTHLFTYLWYLYQDYPIKVNKTVY